MGKEETHVHHIKVNEENKVESQKDRQLDVIKELGAKEHHTIYAAEDQPARPNFNEAPEAKTPKGGCPQLKTGAPVATKNGSRDP